MDDRVYTLFMIFIFLFISALSFAVEAKIERTLIKNIFHKKESIEIFSALPDWKESFPVLVLVHGHQGPPHLGAGHPTNSPILRSLADVGMMAVAFSQPGYGKSSGLRDHAGELSQTSLKSLIYYLRSHPKVRKDQIFLYGISMGATLAALVATEEADLAGVILESGMYDIDEGFDYLRLQSRTSPTMLELISDLQDQTKVGLGGELGRSILDREFKIIPPTLILTGLGDRICLPDQSLKLHERINAGHGQSKFVFFPFSGHSISFQEKLPVISDFVISKLK